MNATTQDKADLIIIFHIHNNDKRIKTMVTDRLSRLLEYCFIKSSIIEIDVVKIALKSFIPKIWDSKISTANLFKFVAIKFNRTENFKR